MNKFINFLKEIHFINYTIYLLIITIICTYTKTNPLVEYACLTTIAFAFMNTWHIEKKEKKQK